MVSYTYKQVVGQLHWLNELGRGGRGGGRNSPNNSRAFDEPMFSWNDNGGSSSGLCKPIGRTLLRAMCIIELGWLKSFSTDFGIFQVMYQGSPETSYMDVGASAPSGLRAARTRLTL